MALRGLGLASGLDVRGAGLITTAGGAAFQRALRTGAAAPTRELYDAVLSPAFTSGDAFGPAVLAEVYGQDALWAGAAQLVDGRVPGRCGGGGCNAPSCAWQYWNIGLPCTEQNLQAYMFQAVRYVWAQQRLEQLLLQPPTRWDDVSNRSIAEHAPAWELWLGEVYRAMGLLRWASNVRWELVTSKVDLPFEWGLGPHGYGVGGGGEYTHPLWGRARADLVGANPLLERFMEAATKLWMSTRVFDQSAAPTMLMESPLTWAYQQAGLGYFVDCCGWNRRCGYASGNPDSGGDLRELAWPLRVPQTASDFAPSFGYWESAATPTAPAVPVTGGIDVDGAGRRIAYEYQCAPTWQWMNYRTVVPAGGLARFLATGRRTDIRADELAMSWQFAGRPLPNVVPTPLMQVLVARTRAEAYARLGFGDAVSAGLAAWAEMIAAQPETMRGQDAQNIEALQARIAQNALNEAAGYVGAAFGAAASIATTVIPQPYGAIVGAVIAIVGAIVTALMGAAYDIGLARPDRPPCPAPPLLRMIGSAGSGREAACDFDQMRRGIEEVSGKSVVVSTLAAGGIPVGSWLPALEALSVRPMDAAPPALPPPDVSQQTPTWKYVAGGLAVGASVLGLAALFGR